MDMGAILPQRVRSPQGPGPSIMDILFGKRYICSDPVMDRDWGIRRSTAASRTSAFTRAR